VTKLDDDRALSLLEGAHQACLKSPDRDVLGMSHGPFSGVNEVLGMFAVIEQDFKRAAARITELEAENARLREALQPFASAADDTSGEYDDQNPLDYYDGLTLGDLRRARAALAGQGDGE
jgi:hypothetical protein